MPSLNLILAILYYIIAAIVVVHVVMDNRQPAKTMAWALVIWFVPVAGIVLYLFFGVNTRRERLVSQRQLDQLSKRSMLGFVEQQDLRLPEQHKSLIDLFIGESFSLPFKDSAVELMTDGYQFFPALLRDIAQARHHVHIDMYIIEDDPLGRLVSDALIAKARSGVEVRLIYDDVGCWSVKNRFFERLREEGIEVSPFLPVRFPSFTSKVNYRNHRKLVVIDGSVGYIGGMNIAERYVKGVKEGRRKGEKESRRAPWRDTMVRVSGTGVYSLQRAFLIDWYFVDRSLVSGKNYYPSPKPTPDPSRVGGESDFLQEQRQGDGALNPPSRSGGAGGGVFALLQTVTSSPVVPQPEIMQGYVRIILGARKYVYIETPYFLPTEPVFFALKTAAASGVDVRLLVPIRNDSWFVEWAARSYLREAQQAGISVSLYTVGFLHSKLMVCDDSVCTCGSANVDFRSFENNFEANIFMYGEEVATRMKQIFIDDEASSVALSSLSERIRPRFLVRLCESLIRMLSPLM